MHGTRFASTETHREGERDECSLAIPCDERVLCVCASLIDTLLLTCDCFKCGNVCKQQNAEWYDEHKHKREHRVELLLPRRRIRTVRNTLIKFLDEWAARHRENVILESTKERKKR